MTRLVRDAGFADGEREVVGTHEGEADPRHGDLLALGGQLERRSKRFVEVEQLATEQLIAPRRGEPLSPAVELGARWRLARQVAQQLGEGGGDGRFVQRALLESPERSGHGQNGTREPQSAN